MTTILTNNQFNNIIELPNIYNEGKKPITLKTKDIDLTLDQYGRTIYTTDFKTFEQAFIEKGKNFIPEADYKINGTFKIVFDQEEINCKGNYRIYKLNYTEDYGSHIQKSYLMVIVKC